MYESRLPQEIVEGPAGVVEEEKAVRPFGVSFLAGLNILGALLLMGAAFALGLSGESAGVAAVLGLLGVGQFLIARGLWRLKNWARITALVCYGLSATLGLIALFTGNPMGLVQLLVAGSITGYLSRAHVVEAFRS